MKNVKVLIIGYYGAGNIGDEVLLDATIDLLKTIYESPSVTVLTNDTVDTKENRQVEAVNRNSYFQVIKIIKGSDIVIGGGGSMLQNVTSNKSLIYYLGILNLAKLFRKKVALLGNGIGPIKREFYKKTTKYVLSKLDAIVLRDKDSYKLLEGFGLNNIYLGNDLAFTLDISETVEKENKKVLINLRKWDYNNNFIKSMENFVNYLISQDFKVTLISFQSDNDELVLKRIFNNINSPNLKYFESKESDKIVSEINSSELFIGMRLHGLIFASICSRPFIALSYDPKVSTFSKNLEQNYFEDLNNISINAIIDTFDDVYRNIDCFEDKLRKNNEKIRELSHVHEEVLKNLTK